MTLFTLAKVVTPEQEARASLVLILSVLLPAILAVLWFRVARRRSKQGKAPLQYELSGTLAAAGSLFVLWLGPGQSWLTRSASVAFVLVLSLAAVSMVVFFLFRNAIAKGHA
ncbi:MAG TPA: hypothetical protein VGK74_17020 [Symbiobacteriaceae bacterium]